jgi:hypothetical protein
LRGIDGLTSAKLASKSEAYLSSFFSGGKPPAKALADHWLGEAVLATPAVAAQTP